MVEMDEYKIELFIDSGEEENIELSNLSGNDMEQWKKDTEERALSEYYKRKIKITDQKFDFKKRLC